MKIHWFHKYEKDGWEQWGYTTIWKGKCNCGSTIRSSDISKARCKLPTAKFVLVSIIIPVMIFHTFAYLYINGVYPFNY